MIYTQTDYERERAICDKAEAYARATMATRGPKCCYLTKEEAAHPDYAAWSTIPPKGDALDGGTYEAFRFRNVPWQSGGDGPEIVE